jgi:periplasmic protein TonB
METNKILSANLLDIIFDDRNKDYGAYELRKTYQKRITKALLITGGITLMIFGSLLARSPKPENRNKVVITTVNPSIINNETKPETPKPQKKLQPVQTRTEVYTAPKIVDKVDKPLPTQEDLSHADIGLVKQEGNDPDGLTHPNDIDSGKGIIEAKKIDEPYTFDPIEIEAKFSGNWQSFLQRNLNANVPVDNGAPAGNYSIELQFMVDTNGAVSDIKPLTNLGYGMEQEAIRVLKKATKWEPAIQNGRQVKAYRRQRITFQVLGDE